MFKNNILNLSVVRFYYVLILLILFCQFHCNFGEKLINDLQYPEIANLVSWKGDIMRNASDSALLENELPEINEDNEGPRVNEFSQNGFNQDIVSGQLLDDYEATNDEEKLNEEEKMKTKLLWPTTDSPQMLTNKAIQGVGPLKFAREENDNGANNNQLYDESAQISSAPVTTKYSKLSSWRNNYYSNKMSALENEFKEGEEKRNNKHHFSNFGGSKYQQSSIDSGHEPNSWQDRESEYFNIKNNNANWLENKQSPQRSLLLKQRKPDSATPTFARYRTKINPKEISIGSIKNKQYLKYFNYDLNNSPMMKSDNDMNLQRQNEEIRDAKRYFNGNSIQNYHLRNYLVNLPPNTNANQPSLERKDNANADIRSNTDNKDISDSSVIDESQRARSRALDIQQANNENIVKEALELTHEDKIEDPPTQRAPSNLEKYNTMQKLITLDTSRKQRPENQFDVESQIKFLHPREKYCGSKFNKYPSTYHAPYEMLNKVSAPNYETQLNNVEVNRNNNPHKPNLDGRPPNYQWTDFGNNKNHRKLETNRFSYENYDQRSKKFQEQNVNSENLEQGISQLENVQNYDLSQQYGQEQQNYISVENVDKCNGNVEKNCQKIGWEAQNATKEEPIFDVSNIYVDKHVIPHKKLRQGRSHAVMSNQGRSNEFLNDQGKSNVAVNNEGRRNILVSNQGRNNVALSNKKKSNGALNGQIRNNVAANSKERSNVATKNNQGRKRVDVQEKRVLVPSMVKNKDNFNSAIGGMKLAATRRVPTVESNGATVFSVPTPMAMLPANAVQSNQQHYSGPANVTTPHPANSQCLVSIGPINSPLKINDFDKLHKAVPTYINNSNKLNVLPEEKAELLPTTISQLEATTTEFRNMLLAEAISVINNNVDGKESTANDGQSIRADSPKHLCNSNSMNNVLDTSNQYDYNSSTLHNPNSTSYNQNIDNFESNDTLNAPEEKVSEQQISAMDSQLETKSLVLKSGPTYNAPDQNATISGILSQMTVSTNQSAYETPSKSDQKFQSDTKSADKKKLEVSKAKSNNNNLSTNISNADISATTGVSISNENNDERIQDLMPSSQWTDMYYDDRNRRGIECGCFPANEECDKTVYSDESDQSNFYSLMNKHNPKAMMIRAYNNWIAERENRALSKPNKTRIHDKVVTKIHEKDQGEEENANIGEDMHSYGEEELRPMRFDDPELAFIRHRESSPSRNSQDVDIESGYDEDEQSEGVPLITHAPVKYGKLRNLTNGAFGGLAKQKSWLNRVHTDNSK